MSYMLLFREREDLHHFVLLLCCIQGLARWKPPPFKMNFIEYRADRDSFDGQDLRIFVEDWLQDPDDQADGPLQYHNAQGQDLFQILVARSNLLSAFSAFCEGDRGS